MQMPFHSHGARQVASVGAWHALMKLISLVEQAGCQRQGSPPEVVEAHSIEVWAPKHSIDPTITSPGVGAGAAVVVVDTAGQEPGEQVEVAVVPGIRFMAVSTLIAGRVHVAVEGVTSRTMNSKVVENSGLFGSLEVPEQTCPAEPMHFLAVASAVTPQSTQRLVGPGCVCPIMLNELDAKSTHVQAMFGLVVQDDLSGRPVQEKVGGGVGFVGGLVVGGPLGTQLHWAVPTMQLPSQLSWPLYPLPRAWPTQGDPQAASASLARKRATAAGNILYV